MPSVEVCPVPGAFKAYNSPGSTVVVVDILRATTAICAAFMNGAQAVIPVGSVASLRRYVGTGCLIAGERGGIRLPFADFDNAPEAFTPEQVAGRRIAYSTTNGTQAIRLASACHQVYIGSYFNYTALCDRLVREGRDVLLLCAGWRGRFSLEDTLFAGAVVVRLQQEGFDVSCDAALAASGLWTAASEDLPASVRKSSHAARLRQLGLATTIDYCHTFDRTGVVPHYADGELTV
ncbi:MAG: 2-phosphosulfolactate phosphatase [Bacteroidales bacterium]|jgi:2-phosphosulfolactate phosphatase|nr:2-phosphosulfolactate phosphatase [Bacteroidales bacterium]